MKLNCRIGSVEPQADYPSRLVTGEVRIEVDGREDVISEQPLDLYRDFLRELYAMAFEGRSTAVILTENFENRIVVERAGERVAAHVTNKSTLDADAVLVFDGAFSDLCGTVDKEFRGMLWAIKREAPDVFKRSDVLAFVSPFQI